MTINNGKVVIAYLFTKFDNIDNLLKFIIFFKKNKPGYDHKLLICYKLLSLDQISSLRKITKTIDHIEFIDKNIDNDYDFGSYMRIAEQYSNYPIFFTLGHSYPVSADWLKKIMYHFNKRIFIGSSASNESMFSSFKKKKKIRILFNLKEYFFLKKNFQLFPNPHIRTINFILYGNDYLDFINSKTFNSKKDAWITESGFGSMTNFFLNKDFKILTVNSDGKSFPINNFKNSETYFYKNQSKQLFSDKHSRKYDQMDPDQKLSNSMNVWGKL